MQIRPWQLMALLLTYALMHCSDSLQQRSLRGIDVEKHEQQDKTRTEDHQDFCSSAASPGPIWAFLGPEDWYLPTFMPIVDTLKDGFQQVLVKRKKPVTLRIENNMSHMVQEVKQRVEAGCPETPVVICISCMRLPDWRSAHTVKALQNLTSMGAYLVLYNTEYTSLERNESVKYAKALGAKEVWTYSRSVLASFPPDNPEIIRRYLPPGCASKLILDVPFDAENRELSKVGFLGNWNTRSPEVMHSLEGSGYMQQIVQGIAKTDEQFRQFMEMFPVQVNIHQNLSRDLPMEAFRAAQLLPNGACFLSENVHPLDYEEFKDLAIFDTLEGLAKYWNSTLKGNAAAIRHCQHRFQKLYCQRFDPLRLLKNSGFLDILKQHNFDLEE